jgi:hypothetical protein
VSVLLLLSVCHICVAFGIAIGPRARDTAYQLLQVVVLVVVVVVVVVVVEVAAAARLSETRTIVSRI